MSATRRQMLSAISGIAVSASSNPAVAAPGKIRAIAFDAFPILDPRPIFALVQQLYPQRGVELANLWRTRQFEYTWLRTLTRRYTDFWQVTSDALSFAAQALRIPLTPENQARLMDAYLQLRCWPDVPAALRSLKSAGIRLAFLSNMTERMLQGGIRNSGLKDYFDHVLTTDSVQVFKPDPGAYQMGLDAFGLDRREILFAAFAGWDAAGAQAFGYPTFWVNRQNQPAEQIGGAPVATGASLRDLTAFVLPPNSARRPAES